MTTTANAAEITRAEGAQLLDDAARKWLNMSGPDFIRAWDSGEFEDDERLAVQQVAMLLPFGRP